MQEWFLDLTKIEQIYWAIALISTLIFIFILISTFVFGEIDMDVDTEIEADTGAGFQFITFKNLVAFFCIFGWVGIGCLQGGMNLNITMVISVIAGLIMMTIMAALFYYMSRLQQDNTFKYSSTVGKTAEVYTRIGKNKSSMGKVMIKAQGSLRELDALSVENKDLQQGNIVEVVEVTQNGILIVKTIS